MASLEVGSISATLGANVSQFVSGMRQAQTSFNGVVGSVQNGSKAIATSSQQATASLDTIAVGVKKLQSTVARSMAAIGATMILPSIFNAAKTAIVDFNQQLDQSRIAFTHFAGSAENAEKLLEKLQNFAARTPFNFKDLLGTTQQMMAMGVEAKDLLPRLTAIGDAAAGLGGSPEILQRIQRALGQIQAKGRVQSEELMQLAEVGVPAYQYMADVIGGTIPQALNMMKKGEIDAATAVTGILDGLAKDFGGMMEQQSKTMMGALSTVQDFVQMTVAQIGRPIFDALRETMLNVADFLSSKEMQEGAANLAKNISNGMKQAGEVIGKFLKVVGPTLESLVGNMYDLARAIGNGIGASKPFLLAVAGAFMAVVGAVKIVSIALSPILKLFAENKTLAQALVVVLGVLAIKQRFFGTTTEGVAKAGTALMTSLRGVVSGVRDTIAYQQKLANGYGANLTAMQALRMGTVAGFKAMGAAVKSFAASLLPMLALIIAVELVMKAFEAFGAKQRVTDERTKELTQSIKDQTTALLENKEALESGSTGADILGNALFKTGEESDKLVRAFGALGKTASMTEIKSAAQNFEEYAKQVLIAKGATEEQAVAMANAIDNTDDNKAIEMAYGVWEWNSSLNGVAEALEVVQDNLENVDFAKMAEEQGQALVGAGKLTSAQLLQAQAITEAMPGYAQMSDEVKAIALNQNILTVATDVARGALEAQSIAAMQAEYVQSRLAAATAGSNVPLTDAVSILHSMYDTTKGVAASLEDFTARMNGASNGLIQWNRFLSGFNKKMEDMFDTIALGDKSFKDLQLASYDLSDSISEMIYNADALGMGQEEVTASTIQMVAQFRGAAAQAGYTSEEINGLIASLGILDNLSPEVQIALKLGIEELKAQVDAITKTIMSSKNMSDVLKLSKSLEPLNAMIKALEGVKPRKEKGGGGGGGSSKSDNPFAWVEEWVNDIKEFASAYTSQDWAESLFVSSPQEIADAIATLLDEAQQLALTQVADSAPFFNAIKALGEQIIGVAEDRDRVSARLDEANENLANAISARESIKQGVADNIRGMAQFNINDFTTPELIKSKLRSAISAASKFKSVLERLQSAGFPPFLIQQVVAGGPIDGTQFGEMLLQSSPDDIATYKDLGSQLEEAAQSAGSIAGDIMFGGDIKFFQDQVNILVPALNDLNTTLANLIYQLQQNVSGGAGTLGVTAAAPIEITINAGVGTNGPELGQLIVTALQDYQRRTGAIPIRTTTSSVR
jgi:tape measure domain-containing protein